MPVTSVYRTGGGSSITTDNSQDRAAVSAARAAIAAETAAITAAAVAQAQASSLITISGLSNQGVTISGVGTYTLSTVSGIFVGTVLNVSGAATFVTRLNVSGAATVSGLTVQNTATVSGLTVQNTATFVSGLNVSGVATVSGITVQNTGTVLGFFSLSGAGQAGIASSAVGGTTFQVASSLIKAASTVVLYSFRAAPGAAQQLTIADGGFYIISSNAVNYNWFIAKY
jgi:hypothetical protein